MSLTAVVFPHGLFFLTGQKGEEQGERERLSCRLLRAVRCSCPLLCWNGQVSDRPNVLC